MSNNEIMVSVVMPTYGHEKYIEQAINSVLMQKVDFNYEVLIGEDCSPDNTREILKSMEPNLPDYFHIFYRENNMGMGSTGNAADLLERAIGKYVITLECDDYWIVNDKLQKQVDFLENHLDYLAVAHNTKVVDANGVEIFDYSYPECKTNEYTLNDFLKGTLSGQLTTIMVRREYYNLPVMKAIPGYPGDRLKNFKMAAFGKVYCIQEKMSAYRYVVSSGYSYSATIEKQYKESKYDIWKEKSLKMYKSMIKYSFEHIKTKDSILVSEKMYFSMLWWAVREHSVVDVDLKSAVKDFVACKYKLNVLCFVLKKNLLVSIKEDIIKVMKTLRHQG